MFDFLKDIAADRVENGTNVSMILVIWALILGVVIAAFIIYFRRRVVGSLVRAILAAGAVDEASAKTLAELDQSDNTSAIAALEKSASMRSFVSITPTPEAGKKGNVTLTEESRLYILPDAESRARIQYGVGDDRLWMILLGCVLLVLLGVIATFVL